MNKIAFILIPLALAGCAKDQESLTVPVDRWHVVQAPDNLYRCPKVKKWPDPSNLTDLEVAKLLDELSTDNKICRASMIKVKQFYVDAARKYQQGPLEIAN